MVDIRCAKIDHSCRQKEKLYLHQQFDFSEDPHQSGKNVVQYKGGMFPYIAISAGRIYLFCDKGIFKNTCKNTFNNICLDKNVLVYPNLYPNFNSVHNLQKLLRYYMLNNDDLPNYEHMK